MTHSVASRPGLLALLAAAACSSSGAGGNGESIPISEFSAKVINRTCLDAVRCGGYPDMATCLAASNFDPGQLVADVNAGKTKYDGLAAASCLNAGAAADQAAACSVSGQRSEPNPAPCLVISTGTLADGSACFAPDECLSRSCDFSTCTGAVSCCAGTCDPTVAGPVALGGDCTAPAATCVAGTFCRSSPGGTGTVATCVATIALGQPCGLSNGDQCAGSLCIGDPATGTQGVCGRLPAEGETCAATQPSCDARGDFCDPTSMKCAPKIAVGEACPSGMGCVDYAVCDTTTSTCLAKAVAGAACGGSGAPPCLGSLVCTAGQCAPASAGTVCI